MQTDERLYGLKQYNRSWFGGFAKVIKGHGYLPRQADYNFFIKAFDCGESDCSFSLCR